MREVREAETLEWVWADCSNSAESSKRCCQACERTCTAPRTQEVESDCGNRTDYDIYIYIYIYAINQIYGLLQTYHFQKHHHKLTQESHYIY